MSHSVSRTAQTPDPGTEPHSARVWNYLIGGDDHHAVDRALGDQIKAGYPLVAEMARADRAALNRYVRFLAGEAGVRQFLDIGAGLPTANHTHDVAQSVAPESRVVYTDYDPLVVEEGRALLTSDPRGATDYVDADVRDTDAVVDQAGRTLDLTRPVAVILSGVLAYLRSADEAREAVGRVMDRLSPGSYLVILDGSTLNPIAGVMEVWNREADAQYAMRSPAEIRSYFDGLEFVEPGLVDVTEWRPEPGPDGTPPPLGNLLGVARKP